ncbi:hypothetical protein DID80_07315 [Candidatus Marinamargulisbacteria bacterium SCGC AAA071-K20]|nr:hypothetical protein DID80_07315 [Candidatus Marinamargulisbacteria bacterium SCGC AAA071-K20]
MSFGIAIVDSPVMRYVLGQGGAQGIREIKLTVPISRQDFMRLDGGYYTTMGLVETSYNSLRKAVETSNVSNYKGLKNVLECLSAWIFDQTKTNITYTSKILDSNFHKFTAKNLEAKSVTSTVTTLINECTSVVIELPQHTIDKGTVDTFTDLSGMFAAKGFSETEQNALNSLKNLSKALTSKAVKPVTTGRRMDAKTPSSPSL